jgi:hypothetical protein
MKSSIFNFRVIGLIAFLTAVVTMAAASPNHNPIILPGHGNVATPVWPAPIPPANGIAVNTPVWPAPIPPTNGIAVNTPVWPAPIPPTNGVAVNTPVWPAPIPPTNG